MVRNSLGANSVPPTPSRCRFPQSTSACCAREVVSLSKFLRTGLLSSSRWVTPARHIFWLTAFYIVLCVIASYFINVNKFSLHGMYRMRLIRAFLGASNTNRRPNLFTNFDAADNMPMCTLLITSLFTW